MKKHLKKIGIVMLSLGCWQLSFGQSALDFEEGSSQYVEVGNAMNAAFTGTSNITVEGWVNLESSGAFRTIAGNYSSGMQFLLRIDGGLPVFWVDNGTTFQSIAGTTSIPVGTWTHIAGSWDGTTLKVFVNGALEGSNAVSGAFPTSTNSVRVGGSLTGSEYMDGLLDDVRIWNVTRSDADIATYFDDCLTGYEAGLLAWYDFESGSGPTLIDRTINTFDGTLINGVSWTSGLACVCVDDQTVTEAVTSVSCGGSTTIDIGASQVGVNYYLTNSLNGDYVDGPEVGTGGAITMNTGVVGSTTTYNVTGVKPSTGLKFDGVDDNISITHYNRPDVMTIEAWVRNTDYTVTPRDILAWSNPAGGFTAEFMQYGTDVFYAEWNGSTFIESVHVNISDGQWHHIAIVRDGNGSNNLSIYDNGQLVGVNTVNHTINTSDLRIGAEDYFGVSRFYNGNLDHLQVWNYAKDVNEIGNDIILCHNGTESGLLMHYDCEDGTGSSILSDKSPIANTGMLNNMDVNTVWVEGSDNCPSCSQTMTQTATVTVDPLTDQTVTAVSPVFVCNGATTIDLGSSDTGVNYYLRDDANNAIIDGPIAGTGSAISLETGSISSTMDYNVLAYSPGTSSDALKFDGASQIVDCGNSSEFEILGDLTLETWVYVDNFATDWVRLLGKGGLSDRTYGMWLSTTGFIKFQIYGAPNFDLDTPPGVITAGQWHHVALTRTGSDMNIYVDGVLQANGTYSGVGATSTQPFTIGGELVVHDQLDGRQDEVRVWNVGRTQAEIIADMTNCLNGDEPGLVAYFPIEQGTGASDVLDLVSAKNGSLVNMDPATDWMPGATTCGACVTEMSTIATVTIDPINDETVAAASATVCPNTGTTIDLGSSQNGAFYFLRDDSNDAIVEGPTAGNGSALNMNTGNLSATTSYNVLATNTLGIETTGGTNAKIEVTGVDVSNQSFSVEFWAKRNATGNNMFVVGQGTTAGSQGLHIGFRSSDVFTFAFFSNDLNTPTTYTDNNWHHYAVTYDATTNDRNIYVDGAVVATDVALADYAGTGTLTLGNVPWTTQSLNGSYDNVRIWNKALSSTEVADNMNDCVSGSEFGLIAAYALNDGAGSSTAADLTGNYNGTLTNMNPATDWAYGSPGCGCEFEMTTIETVTVQDNAPTVAAAPSNMTMGVDAGQCGAVVNYTAPTFDDDCDGTGLAGTMTAGQASGSLFPVGTTTVTYEYTDGSGQSVSASFDVTINDDENPSITAPGPITVNANNAGCTATGVTLGTPTTMDNCSGETFTNDAPATFPNGNTTITWTVTDAAGNQSTDTQIVTVTTDLAGSITETPADCNGNATGSADLTVSGGTSAYTFLWDDASASTTEDLTGLAAGTYNVDITDANGCTAMASITVIEPAAISIAVDGSTDPTGCGVADGTASVTVTGGTVSGAYTYSWSDGGTYTSSVEDPIDMPAGSIQLTVTDDNGCMETTTVSLSDPNGPTIAVDSASSTLVLACNGDMTGDIQIDVTLNGGATSATYLWDDMSATTTEDLTGVGAGTYSVTVTDDNSCVASTSVTISEPTALSGSGTSTDELVGMDGTIDLTVTGGTAPYTFSWTGPNGFTSTDEDPTGLEAGTYDVTITDDNGCTTTVQVIVGTQVSVYEQDGLAINLYPNPSNGDFTLVSNVNHGQLIVRDALGRELHVQNVIGNQTDVNLNVNESGIYFVEFRSDDKTQTVRVVVRK